jgi:hypothetical protein
MRPGDGRPPPPRVGVRDDASPSTRGEVAARVAVGRAQPIVTSIVSVSWI